MLYLVRYVLLLFFAKIAFSSETGKKLSKYNDYNVKHTFAKLLKTIVRVNEERLGAMTKITELQDYMLTKNRLRPDDDTYDSLEEEDKSVIISFGDPPRLRRTEDGTITRQLCRKLFLEKNNVRLWTSQFLKQACHTLSVDFCVNACTKSVKNICEDSHCSRKPRRDSETECRDSCKVIFKHIIAD